MKKTIWIGATAAAGIEGCCWSTYAISATIARLMDGFDFKGDRRAIIEDQSLVARGWSVKIVVGTPWNTEELFQRCLCFGLGKTICFRSTFSNFQNLNNVKSKLHNNLAFQAISKKAVVKKLQETLCPTRRCSSWKMGQSSRSKYRS